MEKEKSKFAFVTAASENYLPGLIGFFNSLVEHGHKEDVILCSFRLPQVFLDKLEILPYNVRVIEMKGDDQVQETAIERFRVASEIGKEYEAICLVEGDIFLTSNVNTFFEAAGRGMIIVGSNGMIVNFGKNTYQKQYNISLGVDEYPYPKVHTTVPIFLNRSDLDWFDDFYKRRMNARSFDDVFGLNIIGIKMGKSERMICMPPTIFTQIHHFGIKPITRLMKKAGIILDGFEQQVYMVHGKYWNFGWYDGLMMPMPGFWKDNDFGERQKKEAYDAREVILNEFLRLCYRSNCNLNLKEFTKKEWQLDWLEKKLEENGI